MAERKPGRPTRRSDPSSNPLDAEKRRLQEEATRLQAEMDSKKRLIADAPRLKEKAEKQRREELVKRRSTADVRFGRPGALHDPRYSLEANVGAAAVQGRRLRKHRRQGMWTFFLLCCVLAGVLYWVYAVIIRGVTP